MRFFLLQNPVAERQGQDLLPRAGQDKRGRLCCRRLRGAQVQNRSVLQKNGNSKSQEKNNMYSEPINNY
jgi:hypothetical protein